LVDEHAWPVSVAGSPYRWAILAVCVAGFMQTHVHRVGFAPLIPTFIADMGLTYAAALGYALDLTGSFPAAFTACAVFEVVALAIAMFARETGRRAAV
jgi:hypothetical protein